MNQEEAELINDLDLAMDAEHWITMNGSPVLVEGTDGSGYEVKGGAGGKMSGVKVSPKSMSGARLNEKTSSFGDPSFKPHEPTSQGLPQRPKRPDFWHEIKSSEKVKGNDFWNGNYYSSKKKDAHRIYVGKGEYHISSEQRKDLDSYFDGLKKFNEESKDYRQYLNVPFEEKEVAKKHKANWDAEKKKWYVPHDVPLHDELKKYQGAPQAKAKTSTPSEPSHFGVKQSEEVDKHVSEMSEPELIQHIKNLNKKSSNYNRVMNEGGEGFDPFERHLFEAYNEAKKFSKSQSSHAKDHALALDKSLRTYDTDGRMHVEMVNISKATVNPYRGSEIPSWQDLGLDADKVYQMLRDPKELEAAAPTFKNLPLLIIHEPVNAEDSKRELTVGTTGSDTEFAHPYLRCSLAIWDKEGIAAVESGEQKELSSAYHYDPDMTAGEFEGVKYDGVMRNIRGNHVALVDVGRAGRDVVVSDQDPFTNRNEEMTKKNPLAKDGEIDVDDAVKLLEALNGESPTPAVTDEFPDENEPAADNSGVLDFLKGKLSDEDMATITSMLSGGAADEAPDDETTEDEAPAVPVPPKDTDKSPAMDAAMVGAVVNAALKKQSELFEARKAVESIVGECAMDSAAAVYKFALGEMGIDTKGIHPSAYPALVSMAKDRAPKANLGMDRAAVDKVAAQFPDINRFSK